MRKIQKTISLEPMTSRLPSVLPAYFNNRLYFFDDMSLRLRKYEHTSNWGMIPVNVVLNDAPSATTTYSLSILTSLSFVLSFDTLSKWYHFFAEYYNLLNSHGHCNMTYSSATEYYKNESKSNYANQMVYGSEEETYIELDNTFAERGGVVKMVTENFKTSAVDNGFFKWVCENIVPTFTIPFEYRDYWCRKTLFYPDVIKELAWFSQRLNYDDTEHNYGEYKPQSTNEVETWNCKNENVDNCCDCEKYFSKGGRRTYDAMVSWYNNVQDKINALNNYISGNTSSFVPSIILPTEFQNSVDDLGEFSIFSKDYELGTDYRTVKTETVQNAPKTIINYDGGNTHGGTIVAVSGSSMILNDDKIGFKFNSELMEQLYDEEAFREYTEEYVSNSAHTDEFNISLFMEYCFTEDNRKVTWNNASDEQKARLYGEVYHINKTNSMYIDGFLYDILEHEYGIYDYNDPYLSGNTYFVYREDTTDTPYVWLNGKKIYASLYNSVDVLKYYFPFFKKKNSTKKPQCLCNKFDINDYQTFPKWSKDVEDTEKYVSYHGIDYVLEDNYTFSSDSPIYKLVDESLIYKVDGTFKDKDGVNYYCNEQHVFMGEFIPIIEYDTNGYASGCTRIKITNPNTLGMTDSYWFLNENTSCMTASNGEWCIIYKDIAKATVYNAKTITGKTASKIYDLRSNELLVDDAGFSIEGVYLARPDYADDEGLEPPEEGIHTIPPSPYKRYAQPPQYGEIEPIYQVGNTANIKRFSLTVEDEDKISGDTNYFVGDIITNMQFYYVDGEGNVLGSKYSSGSGKTSLDAIKDATSHKSELAQDDIRCDITYYVGATLSRTNGKKYQLADEKYQLVGKTKYNNGIKYTETVKFVKTEDKYFLRVPSKNVLPINALKPINNNIYIPIYTYKLTQDKETIYSEVYDSYYDFALATFEATINTYEKINLDEDGKWEFDKWEDMAKRNNMEVFPVFREEYKMGVSVIEKVDSDIYIDRGMNASFEKHLKLGEVASLEALEQYGNGYFKIIDN